MENARMQMEYRGSIPMGDSVTHESKATVGNGGVPEPFPLWPWRLVASLADSAMGVNKQQMVQVVLRSADPSNDREVRCMAQGAELIVISLVTWTLPGHLRLADLVTMITTAVDVTTWSEVAAAVPSWIPTLASLTMGQTA